MKNLLIVFLVFFAPHLEASEKVNLISLHALYVVPAEDHSLDYVFSTPEYLILDGPGDSDAMEIVLPLELVGNNNRVKMNMVSVNGLDKSFSSDQGNAKCSGKWAEMICDIRFSKIEINISNRDKYIRSNIPEENQAAVFSAALRFETDPIGKVLITGKKK